MSLADYEVRKEPVMYQGVVATTVRGIALRDITSLLHGHLAELNKVFAAYEAEGANGAAVMKGAEFAMNLANDAPDLVESIIIAATDDTDTPELREKLKKLPLGLTVEVLRKIIEVTVEDAGGAKKLIDSLVGMVRTIRPNENSSTA